MFGRKVQKGSFSDRLDMPFLISLSDKSRAILKKDSLSLTELQALIHSDLEPNLEHQKLVSLLLEDLFFNLCLKRKPQSRKEPIEREGASSSKIALLSFLGFAGLINFTIWGFDGVVSVIQLFTNSPLLIYVPGAFFSLIAGLIFISFDFNQGAKELGVDFFEFTSVVSEYIIQQTWLKRILETINLKFLAQLKMSDDELKLLVTIIGQHTNRLKIEKEKLICQDDRRLSVIIEKSSSLFCGLLFLFDGYFCGQSGAMFILGVGSISAWMATPLGALLMVTLGAISAIGAAAFYYLVQQRSVEELVSNALGIHREKIDEFCQSTELDDVSDELEFREELIRGRKCTAQKERRQSSTPPKRVMPTLTRSWSTNFFRPDNVRLKEQNVQEANLSNCKLRATA